MQGLVEFVKTLGASRIAAMGAVTIALIGFFVFLIMRVTTPQMTPLFTDLAYEDSAAIVKELDRQAVPYELRDDGNIVLVPKDRVARLRMAFAEGGLPKGGGVGYEIFDKSEVLGTTSFVQNINNVRALEGELARTIRSLDRVQDARVHLVMPDRPLFSRDKVDATASIVLKVRGTLEPHQVRAIRHLVAGAVNGLRPERVSVVDERGQLLADGASDDPNGGDVSADERQAAFEKRLREPGRGDRLLGRRPEPRPRPGRRRFRFQPGHPDLGQIRSRRPRRALQPDARGNLGDQRRQGEPGHGRQRNARRPAPAPRAGADSAAARDQSRKSEEIVNYEISKTTKTEVIEGGRRQSHLGRRAGRRHLRQERQGRKHLSAAQQGRARPDRDAGALGDRLRPEARRPGRGRQSALCRDARPRPITEPSGWLSALQFTKDDIMRAIEMVVMGLLGLVVLLMVVRPLVRRIITPDERAVPALPPGGALGDGSADRSEPRRDPAIETRRPAQAGLNQTSKMIDIAQVQGQVHAQSVQKVGEIADKNPRETVSIIRQWLHESAAA